MTTFAATPPLPSPPPPPALPPRRSRLLHPDPVVRRLAWLTLVNAFGNGLFMTVGVLFFTRALHFSAARVGLGLTAAGLCGVLASMPAGRAADRWGTKPVLMVLVVAEGAGTACYGLVHGFPMFVLLACLVTAVDRGSSAVRSTLYAQALPKDARVRGRAYLRAVTNIAIGAGASLAALALQADTREAYVAAILVDAATFAAVALMLPSIPTAPVPADDASGDDASANEVSADGASGPDAAPGVDGAPRPRSALRDLPFLVVTLLNAVVTLQFALVEVGLPLWLVQSTHAPRVLVAPLLIVNTVLVVLLQVRATRGTDEPGSAAVAFRRGALLVAAGCVVAAAAHGLAATAACLVLLASAVLQSLGEVLSQAGGWALSYALAREDAMGAYQGLFNAGTAAAMMLGPGLVTVTALDHGLAGWILLAAVFTAAGAAMPFAVRRTGRRPHPEV